MKIRVECVELEKVKCDLLIVNEFVGVKQPGGATGAADKALGGLISKLSRAGELDAKLGSVTTLFCRGDLKADKVAIAGLGERDKFDLEAVRRAAAAAIKEAKKVKAKKVATIIHGAGIGGLEADEAARAVVEGSLLGDYQFSGYAKEKDEPDFKIEELVLIDRSREKIAAIKSGAALGEIVSQAENSARDLVNHPSNKLTPSDFAAYAERAAKNSGLKFTLLDPKKAGMEALWAVAKGSKEAPKLVAIEYNSDPKSKNKVALIGKGITFDSGGISLKPSKSMDEMKTDMAGAAAVLEVIVGFPTIVGLKKLGIKQNIIAVMPLTENMPDGGALKPGDVIGSLSGYTIEIPNTDAEGRLILADAITFARQKGATQIVDVATLTGGCIVALGDAASGVMGNDQELIDKILKAGKACGQKMWQLPLYDEYKEAIKSRVADIKNTSGTGKASPSSGAAFLSKFVGDIPWAHLDIAGTAWIDKGKGYLPDGATGVPVRTLIEFLCGEDK